MRKVGAVALMLLALTAPAAFADATLDTKSAAADAEVTITVVAPGKDLLPNDKVTVDVPAGFVVLSCGPVDGFGCRQTDASGPARTVVVWQRERPTLKTERFGFHLRTTAKPGAYPFVVNQVFADGTTAQWRPTLQVTPAPVAAKGPVTTRAAARPVSATGPAAARGASAADAESEPVWARERGEAPAAEIAVTQTRGTNTTPRMLIAGSVAVAAAVWVYRLRRRVASTA
jgi:uncharacterized protein YcnI